MKTSFQNAENGNVNPQRLLFVWIRVVLMTCLSGQDRSPRNLYVASAENARNRRRFFNA
jgi:hypothetical protein